MRGAESIDVQTYDSVLGNHLTDPDGGSRSLARLKEVGVNYIHYER
jgi:hypothetical protein